MTDPLGQSQVLPYLLALSAQGYDITLLSFEKKKRYTSERKIIEKMTRDAGITWVPLMFSAKPPLVSKMYDRWQMLSKATQLHRKHRYDIIHCRSYISAEVGLELKQKTGSGFLFDMRGFWPDEKVDCGQWDLKKLFYRKLYQSYKKKEEQFLLNADRIVSLTKAGKDYLLSKPVYNHLCVDVIPCCADFDHFDFNRVPAAESLALKKELGIKDDQKVITYLGSIGGWYMTDEMFDFYRQLLKKYPEFVMLILTKDEPQHVVNEASAKGIPMDKLVIRYAKRSEVPLYLSISDISLFFIRPTFSKTASSPTKHAELMGMGIPVVCNDIGDTGTIISATGTGLVIKDFSDKAYADAIDKFPALLKLSRDAIRKSAFQYFDLQKGAADYGRLYEEILNRRNIL
jgi:glycosyltransferase involved in cell wall biosynthesis